MRTTGTVKNRVTTRRHSVSAPMSFGYTVNLTEEKAQPTPAAQSAQDQRWLELRQLLLKEREVAHV